MSLSFSTISANGTPPKIFQYAQEENSHIRRQVADGGREFFKNTLSEKSKILAEWTKNTEDSAQTNTFSLNITAKLENGEREIELSKPNSSKKIKLSSQQAQVLKQFFVFEKIAEDTPTALYLGKSVTYSPLGRTVEGLTVKMQGHLSERIHKNPDALGVLGEVFDFLSMQ